jgi:pimeloyl-ACP methyl ester carboxylesterase
MLYHLIVGEGKPLLILHGVTLDHRYMMDTLEPAFNDLESWKWIYVDMPGHGQSPPQGSINSQGDLLASVMEFADQILPNQRFGIIGLSRGSYIVRGMVHRAPDQITGVALIMPGGNPSADPARLPPHQILESDPSMRAELQDEDIWKFENFMVLQRCDILERGRRVVAPAK